MAAQTQTEALGETLIPAINKLQDIFSQAQLSDFKLELPQVAVIGSQSSGKSSVLEALVGRDFLPRGPEICTRRPLVLQLVKQSSPSTSSGNTGNGNEWGEFLHHPAKRFYDFDKIRQEILNETERVVGSNKAVSQQPIRLKICSPNVLTMTLVDLPGITRVPVGDQPSDIEARIRKMVLDYIRHPTCIILAVSPANADLVNSDALELARFADPEGLRTIGVLSKLDIMDRGTDASAVLRNEVVPLRLGYVGVVNRSQQDINTRRSIRDARAAEAAFFESRPEYASVAAQCGTPVLARTLNRILVDHIRGVLPQLRAHIEEALDQRQEELRIYGDAPPGHTSAARGALMLQLLDAYSVRYGEMLDGRSEHLPVSELAGGARIRHIFQEIFVTGLNELNPSSELSDDDVRTAIKNSGGVKGSLLIPEAPFELLVRRAISRLLPSALQCKDFVHAELLRIAGQCCPQDVARFPTLQKHLTETVEEFINEGAGPAERMIRDLVDCEHAYINTDHPQFIGGNRAIAQVLERRGASSGDDEEDEPEPPAPTRPAKQDGHSHGHGHHTKAKSTGNMQESAAVPQLGSAVVRQGARVPLGEAAMNGHRVGLKGVEPELFTPEELMGPGAGAAGGRRGTTAGEDGDREAGTSASWFSSWFGSSEQRRAGQRHGPDAPLSHPPLTLRVPGSVTEQEEVQVEVTRLLVESYFDIVRKNLQDAVPKAVMHFLVGTVQRGLQQHLIRAMYREELFEQLMAEREDVAQKRGAAQAQVKVLRDALSALEKLPASLISRLNASGRYPASEDGMTSLLTGRPLDESRDFASPLPLRSGLPRGPGSNPKALSSAARMAVAALASAERQSSLGFENLNPFQTF